jgi:solute carrier family 15 (oligopeptide transporter), member 1
MKPVSKFEKKKQAPLSMKSVIVAGWYLSVAFGNIFVIIIAEVKFFKDQVRPIFSH